MKLVKLVKLTPSINLILYTRGLPLLQILKEHKILREGDVIVCPSMLINSYKRDAKMFLGFRVVVTSYRKAMKLEGGNGVHFFQVYSQPSFRKHAETISKNFKRVSFAVSV